MDLAARTWFLDDWHRGRSIRPSAWGLGTTGEASVVFGTVMISTASVAPPTAARDEARNPPPPPVAGGRGPAYRFCSLAVFFVRWLGIPALRRRWFVLFPRLFDIPGAETDSVVAWILERTTTVTTTHRQASSERGGGGHDVSVWKNALFDEKTPSLPPRPPRPPSREEMGIGGRKRRCLITGGARATAKRLPCKIRIRFRRFESLPHLASAPSLFSGFAFPRLRPP